MERDDDGASAGVQSCRQSTLESGLKVIEFLVGGDPQRLEDAGCRMCWGSVGSARGKRFEDRFDQVVRGANGSNRSPRDNLPGDLAAGPLLAIAREQIGQLGLSEHGQDLGRGSALRRVKTHV